MTANYKSYIEYLASFADSHRMAVEAERNIYPLFADLKKLIEHYKGTISKFSNVQNQLTNFIDNLNFDDNDFDYYQSLFKDLRKVDEYLQELKEKQVPAAIAKEVQDFISDSYNNASLFNLDKLEEQVLSKINLTYEAQRANKSSGCLGVVLLFVIAMAILSFTIIKH